MSSVKMYVKAFVLLLLFSCAKSTYAQEIEWDNTIGGSFNDILFSLQETTDGGYILGGYTCSSISGDKTENLIGSYDYWIIKTDSIGNIQWQKGIGGTGYDMFTSLQQTNDGGYILGGQSNSNISGDKTENCIGYYDYWIVKINSLGAVEWENTIGGNYTENLNSVKQTSDGGYILGGESDSYISGDKTIDGYGGYDFWIVKTDALGSIQWQKVLGGDNIDDFRSINQTSDGGYIVGGTSCSNISGNKTIDSKGGSDYWIIKIDSVGNIQWQNVIGGSGGEALCSVEQTSDGGYVIGGHSSSFISGDKTENCLGSVDYWLVKTDSVGNVKWENTIGGNDADMLTYTQQTDDGGYVLGGMSMSNLSGDKTEVNIGLYDYWVVKTDSLGSVIWQNAVGGTDHDQLYAMQQTSDSKYILGGGSMSNSYYDKTENCIGYDDYWVVKISANYNYITGQVFVDFNGNFIKDSNEPALAGHMVIEQNSGRIAISDQNGNYSLTVLDSGNYLVYPTPLNLYDPKPAIHNVSFSGMHQTNANNNFAFQSLTTSDELSVDLIPLTRFRSGFKASYIVCYKNVGSSTVAPRLVLYPDSKLSYSSSSLVPNQLANDSIVWSLPTLSPFQSGHILVTFNVNTGLPNGKLINSIAHIDPYLTDVNQSNNNDSWEVYTTGAFDPNEILVSNDTLLTSQLSSPPWLDYIINFQNTGNDTAFNVKILNPIDTTKLNISTLEFVNSSHQVNLNWINFQRSLEFKFDNILLPDSNVNEPLSHGFIHYRIKPKINLYAGDSITNYAAIYFDFNEPVITNTAKTVIVTITGLSTQSSPGKLLVYPNPAQSKININGINFENGKAQLRLFDICGKIILEKIITSANSDIDIQNLPSGMYLLQSGNQRATFVKQ